MKGSEIEFVQVDIIELYTHWKGSWEEDEVENEYRLAGDRWWGAQQIIQSIFMCEWIEISTDIWNFTHVCSRGGQIQFCTFFSPSSAESRQTEIGLWFYFGCSISRVNALLWDFSTFLDIWWTTT